MYDERGKGDTALDSKGLRKHQVLPVGKPKLMRVVREDRHNSIKSLFACSCREHSWRVQMSQAGILTFLRKILKSAIHKATANLRSNNNS